MTINQKHYPLAWHLVARAPSPLNPFLIRAHCVEVWNNMACAFPDTIAAALMPNHLHLVLWNRGEAPSTLVKRLRQCLCSTPWQPLPSPEPVADVGKVRRQLRYTHLNPCRKSLTNDPVRWEWSTHLDYLGLIAKPWPRAGNLQALGFTSETALHKYVSSDPTVAVSGTAPPLLRTVPDYLNWNALVGAALLHWRAPLHAFQMKGRHRANLGALLTGPFRIPLRVTARKLGVHPSSLARRHRIITEEELRQAQALITILHDPRLRAMAERLSHGGQPDKVSGSSSENAGFALPTRHFVGLEATR